MKKSFSNLTGFAILFLLSLVAANAQEYRGTITGTVSDPNGAVIPAATVTVQNIETNVTTTASTNDEGSYTFPLLLPGKYKLTATAASFKTSVRESIQVNVGDRLTADFQLELGTTAEVNILADSELLERGSVTTGTVITEQQIAELPLPEGAAYNLASQAPGVSITGNPPNPAFTGPTANGTLAGFRTNGAPGNQFTLDGSPNSIFDGGVGYTPPADAVSQFKIQTSAFDAQNGFTAGSTVNVAVRSGGNNFRGSLYYFDRSKIFSANNFFNNSIGAERPERHYYRYGGQINGPVILPWVYNGKDKTFFMFSYEKQYNKRAEPEIFSVPTMRMRNGDFSELLPAGVLIYDPLTARCVNSSGTTVPPGTNGACPSGTNVTRTAFAGNIIPENRINPAARAFLNLYPEPNLPGTVRNFFSNNLSIQPYDSYLTRIDHNFNGSNRIFGKFFYSKSTEDRYNFIGTDDAFTRGNEIRTNKGGSVDYTTTLSANFILDLRASLNEFVQNRLPVNPISASTLGFTGIAAISDSAMLPAITFTNYEQLGPQRSDFNEGLTRTFTLFSLQPTMTQIFGSHTFKYGYDYRRLMENRLTNGNNAGSFSFTGNFTGPASNRNSGVDAFNQPGRELAAFLLGIPNGGTIDTAAASYDVNSNYQGFFFQDDWRVNQKLTLNLGLRYEIETGVREADGRIIAGFDTTTPNPLRAQVLANYNSNVPVGVPITAFQNLSGGLLFPNSPNDPNQSTDKNNFQPRIGVSYAINDKTVIRGGLGIFTSPFQIQPVDQRGFTSQTTFPTTTNNGLTFPTNINNPFPNGFTPTPGSSQGLATFVGQTLGTVGNVGPSAAVLPYERKNANYTRVIFGIQRELPWKVGFEATYILTKGSNLAVLRQLNYIPREYLNDLTGVTDAATILDRIAATNTFLSTAVANPFRGLVPGVNVYNANTITRRLLLTPFPQFQDLVVTEYTGSSTYQALQLQATKRLSQGLSFNASYTYSKEYDKTRRLNPQDEKTTRMLSTTDRPHRFTFSGVYRLPIGKGRWLGKEWNGWADAFLGGWQFQAVYEKQSGEPIALNGNFYFSGDPTQLRNLLGKRDSAGRRYGIDVPAFDATGFSIIDPRPTVNGTANPNFNRAVFPGVGNNFTVGGANTLRTFPLTLDNFRNQSLQKFDMGFTKNFRIRETMNFQFRIEAINALNYVYFSGLEVRPNNAAFGFANAQRNLPRDLQIAGRFTF